MVGVWVVLDLVDERILDDIITFRCLDHLEADRPVHVGIRIRLGLEGELMGLG